MRECKNECNVMSVEYRIGQVCSQVRSKGSLKSYNNNDDDDDDDDDGRWYLET